MVNSQNYVFKMFFHVLLTSTFCRILNGLIPTIIKSQTETDIIIIPTVKTAIATVLSKIHIDPHQIHPQRINIEKLFSRKSWFQIQFVRHQVELKVSLYLCFKWVARRWVVVLIFTYIYDHLWDTCFTLFTRYDILMNMMVLMMMMSVFCTIKIFWHINKQFKYQVYIYKKKKTTILILKSVQSSLHFHLNCRNISTGKFCCH